MPISAELATKLQSLPETQQAIAWAMAEGKTKKAAGEIAGCTAEWVSQLMRLPEHTEFQEIVDELTMVTGIAVASERARLAKQAVEQLTDEDGKIKLSGKHDALDWLQYQGELVEGPEGTKKVILEFEEPKKMKDLVGGLDE